MRTGHGIIWAALLACLAGCGGAPVCAHSWGTTLDGSPDISAPAVFGGVVYIGTAGGIDAVSTSTHAVLWHNSVAGLRVYPSPVVYDGSVVLPGTTPARLSLGTLAQLLIQAFDKGQLPPPISGVANEYISFTPSTSIVGNLCTGPTAGCGEHSFRNSYKGVTFDVASVPLGKCNCHNMWDSESKKTTEVAEHETAEGLARLAGAGFEVGDRCEVLKEHLTCCGQSYQVQQLAG